MSQYLQPHRGALILVLGILSLVVCAPLGFFAWVMGNTDLREIRAGRMDPTGEGLVSAGRIIGIIGAVLFIVQICGAVIVLLFILVMIAGGAAAASGAML
jgi:hypothetical protein